MHKGDPFNAKPIIVFLSNFRTYWALVYLFGVLPPFSIPFSVQNQTPLNDPILVVSTEAVQFILIIKWRGPKQLFLNSVPSAICQMIWFCFKLIMTPSSERKRNEKVVAVRLPFLQK